MELFRKIYYLVIAISFALFFNCVQAQTNGTENKLLSSRDKSTIKEIWSCKASRSQGRRL